MTRTLFIDSETFSPVPLTHGTHRYAEQAEVMVATYAWNDEPVETLEFPARGDVQELLDEADVIVGHNIGNFDSVVFRHALNVETDLSKTFDTMAAALSHSLPGSLGKLCEVLGVSADDAKTDGKALIQLFCKPRPKTSKLRRATKETHPDEWQQFLAYAGRDITSLRVLYKKLPRWNYDIGRAEHAVWQLDQRINARGVRIDIELARSAISACADAKDILAARTQELTEGEVQAATQRDLMLKHLLEHYGVTLPDFQKGTIERRLEDPDLPDPVRELLAIRLSASSTSVAKYQRLVDATSSDGRLRGALQYCGAMRTGRWAGRIFQPQNLPRTPDAYTAEVQEEEIATIKTGCADLILPDVIESCSYAIRGSMIAAEGKELVVADLSNIEGRVLAWLADETWKIQAFKDYDNGEGPDLYKVTAGRILNKPPSDVTKDERQTTGKVPELACLGADTLVLTQGGLKSITSVTKADRLWDGVEWVEHQGVVSKGLRRTMRLAGVELTVDHRVMAGRTWLSAEMVGSSDSALYLALVDGLESLKSWAWSANLLGALNPSAFSVPAAPNPTPLACIISSEESLPGATPAPSARLGRTEKTGSATLLSFLTMPIEDDSATAYLLALIDATTHAMLGTRTMAVAASGSTSPGAKIEPHSWPISSPSPAGTFQLSSLIEKKSTEGTNPGTYDLLLAKQTQETDARSKTCSAESRTLRPVYDIAHAGPRNRFTVVSPEGHALLVHNCGYQGAAGAFEAMAKIYNLQLSPEEVLKIVKQWRQANANIVQFWYDMEEAARMAVASPGQAFPVGRVAMKRDGAWLKMKLPSGRLLCYPSPKIEWVPSPCMKCKGDGKIIREDETVEPCDKCKGKGTIPRNQITYAGINQYSRKWERLKTYGGKLVENCVQATARDVIVEGLLVADERGFAPLLSVHDEIITEKEPHEDNLEDLVGFMTGRGNAKVPWCEGLPLAADGFVSGRYRK